MTVLLNEDTQAQVKEAFAQLNEPVHVLFFGREAGCDYCEDTRQLLQEVVALSDKLQLSSYDLGEDADIAELYNVDKAPGLVIASLNGDGPLDYGIRFAGIPSGHEFGTLIQDVIRVSSRDSGLSQKTRDFLKQIREPLTLQVFVTPTCPYCPRAVLLAHQMAMESEMVQAEMVEATEFPELAAKYYVSGVPNTTINHGAGSVVGAVPEGHLVAELQKLLAD
jgi:glutaredoxin-like protein